MELDIKALLELRGEALIRELYKIYKNTSPFGFLKTNSRNLAQMKNRNIEERNERKQIKLLEKGIEGDFEPIPLMEEVFLHEFEKIKFAPLPYKRFGKGEGLR